MEAGTPALKFETWYKEETSVYGHLLLPRRDTEKIRYLVNWFFELDNSVRFNIVDEYDWDELDNILNEFGLKYVKIIDSPVYKDGLREAVGKKGFAYYAASQNGDLYAFFVANDYSEFYIFQFTSNDAHLMKVYRKLKEEEGNAKLARDIAREELEMLKVVQELVNALQSAPATPPPERIRTTNIVELFKKEQEYLEKATALPISILKQVGRAANIAYTEEGDKRIEAYLVLGRHGMYIVAFARPILWQEEGSKVLDVLLRRVDPSTAWKCIKEGCQLLRELF